MDYQTMRPTVFLFSKRSRIQDSRGMAYIKGLKKELKTKSNHKSSFEIELAKSEVGGHGSQKSKPLLPPTLPPP